MVSDMSMQLWILRDTLTGEYYEAGDSRSENIQDALIHTTEQSMLKKIETRKKRCRYEVELYTCWIEDTLKNLSEPEGPRNDHRRLKESLDRFQAQLEIAKKRLALPNYGIEIIEMGTFFK